MIQAPRALRGDRSESLLVPSLLRESPERGVWTPQGLVVAGSAWTALVCNWPLWRTVWQLEAFSVSSRVTLIGVLFVATAALLVALLAPWACRASVRVALAVVFFCAATITHFIGHYGVVINPSMMRNVLQTNAREVRELIDAGLLANLLLLGALPAAVLWRTPVALQRWTAAFWRNGALAVGAVAVVVACLFAAFGDLASLMRGRTELRYMITPLNGFYSLAMQATEPPSLEVSLAPSPIGTDAHLAPLAPGQKPRLLLWVVGETARADRFGLNGYIRPTTPELGRLGVVSFTDVTSCGTDTASSLPCMFSLLDREAHLALQQPQENVLDVLQRAGLAVLWLDNQAGCKSLCDRIPSAHVHAGVPGAAPLPAALCPGDECFDEALLGGLDVRLASLDPQRRARGAMIVMHQMGSHGPAYFLRTPGDRKPFQPECQSVSLRDCDKAALDNGYDNTIAYTDHVLAMAIQWLARQSDQFDPALVYVSDHGESLGEKHLYLHGMPYRIAPREQTHVPMIAWWTEATGRATDVSLSCLQARRDKPLSHSHLSHTVLAWFGVNTASLRPQWDAFAACRSAATKP
jgi:lipid A ethanolaminephosphotransferase